MSNKHVYIIGSTETEKYLGYSYSKIDAKEFIERHPDFIYKKINISKHNFTPNHGNELVRTMNGDVIFSADEECMLESFDQFIVDIKHLWQNRFCKDLKYIKFSDEEKIYISKLIEFINGFIQAYDDDLINEIEEEVYDYDAAVKWFIKAHKI